jgi:hypothetical protein
MKLTPHDKAILVGLHMSGGSSEGPPYLLTIDLEITRNWMETVLKEIRRRVPKKELKAYEEKLSSVFFTDDNEPRYPEEYVDKLSPLAIAVWLATDVSGYTRSAWSLDDRNKFMIAFRKKWSILLDVDTLRGHSESDEINLWLLTKKHLQEFAPNLTPSFVANYPRKNKTIYLSGGQQFAVDGGANWRGGR